MTEFVGKGNGFILMSKIGKSTTNMHRAFHVTKVHERKVESNNDCLWEDEENDFDGIDIV